MSLSRIEGGYIIGPTYEVQLPWSWLSWRDRLWRIAGWFGLKHPQFAQSVVTEIDHENATITVDSRPGVNDSAKGAYMRRLLRLWPGVAANAK